MRRIALALMAAGFLVACNRTPTAPTGVPLMASQGDHGSAPSLAWSPVTTPSPDTYDFGTVDPASPSSATFTLTNTGGRSSGTISSVSLSTSTAYSITADGCTGSSLGPNKTCTVTVAFTSTEGSTSTATLTAVAEHASASLDLTGEGGTADLVMLSPADYTGPYVNATLYSYLTGETLTPGQTSTPVEFTIKNQGTASSEVLAGVPDSHFYLSDDQCTGTTLAPGGTCSFKAGAVMVDGCTSGTYYRFRVLFEGPGGSPIYVALDLYATCGAS